MSENRTAKNYHAHGGSEWVIGGKLTFLPGAVVEGAESLFGELPTAELVEQKVPYVPDCEATTVAALREEVNGVLAALREAGILAMSPEAADAAEETEPAENAETTE